MADCRAGIAVANSRGMDRTVNQPRRSKLKASTFEASSRRRAKTDRGGEVRLRIERKIRSIPRGKVSTYGAIAAAAGLPGGARIVARTLHQSYGLPWQRVLGSGGEIKLRGDSAIEQRLRLEAEGVRFRGRKVDMKLCEWKFGRSRRK
jgi:alkylated DNA nucleotide flippase Atl1